MKKKPKFSTGDIITPIIPRQGIENLTIVNSDDNFYYCKMLRGRAIIPVSSIETQYKLVEP